jgi:hypothetical protein
MKQFNKNLNKARKLMPANPRFQLLRPEPFKTIDTHLSIISKFKYNKRKKHVYKHKFQSFSTFYKRCFENNLPVIITKESILEPICMSMMRVIKEETIYQLLPKLKKIITILQNHVSDDDINKVVREYFRSVKELFDYLFSDEDNVRPYTIKIELYSYQFCQQINRHSYRNDFEKYLFIRNILGIEFKPMDQIDFMNIVELIERSKLKSEIHEFKQLEQRLFDIQPNTMSFLPKLNETCLIPNELCYLIDQKSINLEQIKKHIESTNYIIHKDIIKNKFSDIELENDQPFWNKLHQFIDHLSSIVRCEYIKTYLHNVINVLDEICIRRSLHQMLSTNGTEWDGWYYKLFYRKSDIHDRSCDIKNIRMIVQYFKHKEANYILPSRKQKKS